ncbi:MAG: 4-hydroxy-tetrahydrodipicolinate synthase [Alphaproteobacteria bacterium]|nr:4-hydroxy-tetrahydrodipicolinate synthase [Alphaproteobacteria bacterium]
MFKGINTALVTPFKNGAFDEAAFRSLVEWQIESGIHGLVPCGTTGESPTLTDEEQLNIIGVCISQAQGRVPVIAGCGSNNTAHAIHLTQMAEQLGASAALHVAPYYNKPTQEGLYQHFKAVHDATDIPIIIYNIPGRSVVNIADDTMARLAQLPRIAGIKDSTGDITKPLRLRESCGNGFAQLTGEDALVLPYLAQGGHGVISVTSNIAPKRCVALYDAWSRGDIATAQAHNRALLPLHDALFCETSPSPAKYAASRLGFGNESVRLPLVPASANARARVDAALKSLGISQKPSAQRAFVP